MADTELIGAVRKLVKAKGRYHTEQNYLAVVAALDMHDADAKARRSTSSVSEGEMPELPKPKAPANEYFSDEPVYSADEVREIIAADRRARQGEPVAVDALLKAHEEAVVAVWEHGAVGGYRSDLEAAENAIRAATKAAAPADAPIVRPLDDPKMAEYLKGQPWISAYIETLECELRKAARRAPAEDAREEVREDAVGRAALMEFAEKYCLNKPELVSCAEAAFYWFNKCARRATSVPAIQGTPWISVQDELPDEGERVLVTRFAGRVGNPEHPGHPGVPWVEFTRYMVNCSMFECDLLSTGNVTHWARITAAPSHPSEAKAGEDA